MKHLFLFEDFSKENIMYHATDGVNVQSILKDGLLVSDKKRWSQNEYPKGIYLFNDRDSALRYAVLYCDDGEVLQINVQNINLKKDPESTIGSHFEDSESFYATDNIPPEQIKWLRISKEEKDDIYRQYENFKII